MHNSAIGRDDHVGGNSRDLIKLSELLVVIDINFHRHKIVLDGGPQRSIREYGAFKFPARATPVGPKVEQNQPVRLGRDLFGPLQIGLPTNLSRCGECR